MQSVYQTNGSPLINYEFDVNKNSYYTLVLDICLYGARDAKLKNGAICEHKNQQFNAQTSSLHGMDRAEFIEIG